MFGHFSFPFVSFLLLIKKQTKQLNVAVGSQTADINSAPPLYLDSYKFRRTNEYS